ncbi:hypothetical protein JXA40_09670 [bacterium]|nr:hypothetical protein [candidate division CSSED10-310 bacterium]
MPILKLTAVLCIITGLARPAGSAPIADHTCTDLNQIPQNWIDTVKNTVKLHYAHTSHGSQLTIGLQRIETQNHTYDIEIGYSSLPAETGALCIFDGQEHETYITPELYWKTPEGRQYTRDVLDHNPAINISGWAWCCQLDGYSSADTDDYLCQMSVLETEYPGVRFVYFTGNAQATGTDGYNRWRNNEKIRTYCRDHDRILFDFADLDAWWFNEDTHDWEQATYQYEGYAVPFEHPEFHGSEGGHTTYESCEQKGRALWWLLAAAAGWNSATPTPGPTMTPAPCDKTGAMLWMPSDYYTPDDLCSCIVTVCNLEDYELTGFPLFVILDVYGIYFFAPSFSDYDNYLSRHPSFSEGATEIEVLPEFAWPRGTGSASGILWYAALTNPEITQLFGEMDTWTFGWSQ